MQGWYTDTVRFGNFTFTQIGTVPPGQRRQPPVVGLQHHVIYVPYIFTVLVYFPAVSTLSWCVWPVKDMAVADRWSAGALKYEEPEQTAGYRKRCAESIFIFEMKQAAGFVAQRDSSLKFENSVINYLLSVKVNGVHNNNRPHWFSLYGQKTVQNIFFFGKQ